MNVGICVCVLLAALSSGSLSLPSHTMSQRAEGEALSSDSLPQYHTRQARSAPAPPSGQLPNYIQPQEDADARNSLSQLLARLISRKGSPYQTRSSLTSRASGLAPGHRIKDRDYLGWMDFGRRSAEEYEYSS
ncbi:cholecystokinin a [Dicentrarchus labrax]|uniref:Gastrin/cholecystokinin peptide hormone domain-containing protein n=1 Tax=Dicentrarchus labrax TaxID=13489 RepID=A0A8C4DR37_DICLA|nr:cholecystokinin a [Dicentrarchus labrax]